MIELKNDGLVISFPEVHPQATLRVELQRTLRVPDDGRSWPLPPGLGAFPIRHVDDFAAGVPRRWTEHGGVMVPVHNSEALWLRFVSTGYPFALQVAAGKINAVTGDAFADGLQRWPQNYLVTPDQPWLDGYCVGRGRVRQFVAVPLGAGRSAEEQITGRADVGGLQLLAVPMRREAYERRFQRSKHSVHGGAPRAAAVDDDGCCEQSSRAPDLGLAPGGALRQELRADPYDVDEWDQRARSRCFVHLCDAAQWQHITGQRPPTTPPTASDYRAHGLPWFEQWSDPSTALHGSPVLRDLQPVDDDRRAPPEGSRGRWWVREGDF